MTFRNRPGKIGSLKRSMVIALAGSALLGGAMVCGQQGRKENSFMNQSGPQRRKLAAKAGNKSGTIVFVCHFGSAKSVVAARFFNRIAAEEGLRVRAVARGIEPEAEIPPYVRGPIRADHFEIAPEERPVPLDVSETRGALAVVCIGNSKIPCKLPPEQLAVARQFLEWTDVPNVDAGYAPARDRILSHLKELVVQLRAKPR